MDVEKSTSWLGCPSTVPSAVRVSADISARANGVMRFFARSTSNRLPRHARARTPSPSRVAGRDAATGPRLSPMPSTVPVRGSPGGLCENSSFSSRTDIVRKAAKVSGWVDVGIKASRDMGNVATR